MFKPYVKDGRALSRQKGIAYIESVQKQLPEIDQYKARLIGWLNCVPYLRESFRKNGICEEIFYESMKDFSYKFRECRAVYETDGLFVDWFSLFFELKLFALGRLQYEISTFEFDSYSSNGFKLKEGDIVYSCHIPSSGKLTTDLCMQSFQKAYNFFNPYLNGEIIPIVCNTWLLYEPYIEAVFPNGSNLKQFSQLFDIIHLTQTGDKFEDSWRVFNKFYNGTTEDLPDDNTLRRNFIKYIKNGGDFGVGYGIILYNGKTNKIVNQKSLASKS